METVFIGVGSNQGNALAHCVEALDQLIRTPGIEVVRRSRWFRTEPFGNSAQPWFINGVIELQTAWDPFKLLDRCQSLETEHGRTRTISWGPRTLDLDILLWENRVMSSQRLVIPHPWMHCRRFVLAPLCDLAPGWRHPLSNVTMKTLLDKIADSLAVEPLIEPEGVDSDEKNQRTNHSIV